MSYTTALIAAVTALFLGNAALLKYIAHLHKAYGKKINELYDARICDLMHFTSKTANLEDDVTLRQRGLKKKGGE
jgi:hypothetical protein